MNNNSEFMPVECLNVPKVLFYDKQYEDLSMDAKLIYALLLDRKEMAIRNEWVDEYGDTYVIYPKQEIKKYLNISRYRIDQALAELEEHDQMVEVAVPYPGKLCQFYVKDITDNEKQMEEDIMKKMKESNGENFCRASGCGYARCFTGISPKYMAKMNKEDRNNFQTAIEEILEDLNLGGHVTAEPLMSERTKEYVLADVTRIREVLVNLLGNAVKFTKDGGKITLDISTYPGTDEKHIIIRYVVQDNGIGMSEEFQKELFKPFSQEDNANARTKYKGTGLGMAITQKYVDMMGGSIAVESKKGVGSTFTVEIPLELQEQVIQSEQKQPLHRDLTGVHVLMAEDNDLNAELATIMLEDAGMTVTRASDGKEVVNLFKNHPRDTYDLILMDIMMPNMDGHQATKAIRALGIERSDAVTIPIIDLSANAFIDDIQESLDSGMNDHISKPINMEEVTDTIAKYIKDDTCLEKELKQKQNDR